METFLPALMRLKKGLQECDMPPGSQACQLLYDAVNFLGMEFSTKHNAKWGLKDTARIIDTMTIHSICAHQAAEILDSRPLKKKEAPA